MTVLVVVGQAVSIALMWRIHSAGAGPKTRRSHREGTGTSADSS